MMTVLIEAFSKPFGNKKNSSLPINAFLLTFLIAVCCKEEGERMWLDLKKCRGLTGVKEKASSVSDVVMSEDERRQINIQRCSLTLLNHAKEES